MRVTRLEVQNFLSFRDLRVDLDPRLQLVAGPNNAGKSSLIRLLEVFFSDPSGSALVELFPLHKYYMDSGPRTLSTIRVWFSDFTEDERATFAPIIRRDNSLFVTLRCRRSGFVDYRASRNTPAEESRKYYREILSRFYFAKIPSVRVGGAGDRSELTSLERLLDTLEAILIRSGPTRSTSLQQDFQHRIAGVETLVQKVMNEAANAIRRDLPFREDQVAFELPHSKHALRGMLEGAVIQSKGDVEVPVSSRGTGFQSALVLGILRYVAEREAQEGGNVLFGIEEPEAFLHPQTQRAMARILREIARDAQVLVTTHSSVLVDSFDLRQIARLPLQTDGTQHTWTTPALERREEGRLSRYCSAANSELVFANAVIFVEGQGDHAVIEKLLSHLCGAPGGHYALGVTVIEATGLGKIKHLVALAEHFGVRSYVLSDIDGLHKRGDRRVLLKILSERPAGVDSSTRDALIKLADMRVSSFEEALRRQTDINTLLRPLHAFVLSSDLEGLLLDSFGVDGLLRFLGPNGEGALDRGFVEKIRSADDAYERLAVWLGSKGWNSDRKQGDKKMSPHLPPALVDRWFETHNKPPKAMAPLVDWLKEILSAASPAPV